MSKAIGSPVVDAAAPRREPSILSDTVLLGDVGPLVWRGGHAPLEPADIPPPLAIFRSRGQDARDAQVAASWAKTLADAERNAAAAGGGKVSTKLLLRMLLRQLPRGLFAGGVACSAMQGLLGTVGRFLTLRHLIRAIARGAPASALGASAAGFVAVLLCEGAAGIAGRQLLAGIVSNALTARASALMMSKVSRTSGDRATAEDSQTVAFYSADFPRAIPMVRWASYLPMGLMSLTGGACGFVILLVFFGSSALVGALTILVFFKIQGTFIGHARKADKELMAARDLRLVALRQVVNAIKAVKYYAWEAQYTELVERLRVEELKHLTTARVLTVTSVSVGKAFPVIATCATLVTVALVGDGTLDAADAFATLAIFQQLRLGMVFTPLAVMLLNIYSASFERCQRFLCRPERKPIAQIPPQSANAVEMIDLSVTRSAGDDGQMIDVDSAGVGEYNAAEGADDAPDAALTGYDDVFALHVPSLDIKRGSVVAVVGSVGSGKTTLVDVLTGGVAADTTTNSLRVDSAMGLAPQIAFVVSGTIRDNILMGRPFDKGAFAAACDLADFSIDIGRFSHGIDTTVGEFGTTLSGGQSHRLNIARAVYGHPRLLLLDGSLAAVDPAVARRIFLGVRNYVKANSERAAVLVVSQLHLLPECDQIVYLEGGRVIAQGTYDEMMTNGAFANFCSSYSTGKDDAEEAVPEEEVKRVPQQAATVAPSSKPVTSDVADLVKKEKISRGMVSTLVIRAWLKSLTHVRFAVVMGGMILSMIVMALNDLTLGAWTRDDGSRSIFYMLVYSAFSVGYLVVIVGTARYFAFCCAKASLRLHGACFTTLLRAPLSWFESTPSGRVISRFAADLENMDMNWSTNVDVLLTMGAMAGMLLIVMSLLVPYLIPVNIVCLSILFRAISLINCTNRDVKRIANNSVSPAVTTMSEAERGRVVAHAIGCSSFFVERQKGNVDNMLTAFFFSNAINNAAWAVALVMSCLISTCTLLFVLYSGLVPAERKAIALSYALIAPFFTGMACNAVLEVSTLATSLERLFEFLPVEEGGVLPIEAPRVCATDAALVDTWPSQGCVVFEKVQLRYRPDLPLSLDGACFTLAGGSKCGVVGRSGAGKSTLMSALFRLTEISGGKISIDGTDLAQIGLQLLRRRLAMIPQDAIIMTGTARENVDPFDEHTSAAVSDAFSRVGLSPAMLDKHLDGGDTQLSVGECQLLAIARVILRRARVVCLDEPTAHIDAATDAKLQQLMGACFEGSTLISIAHRLHTVIGFDRIAVVDAGRIAQFDAPRALLDDAAGPFADMVAALGPATAAKLRTAAAAPSGSNLLLTPHDDAPIGDAETTLNVRVESPVDIRFCGCTLLAVS